MLRFTSSILSVAARRVATRATRVVSRSQHVGIVGAGAVGASCASSIIHHATAANVISLYDLNSAVAEGEVMDLEDEGYFTGTAVKHARSLSELRECDIIVITAGAKQLPNEPRSTLLERNATILKSIIDGLMPVKSSAILLLVTNPVDVLTILAQHWTEGYLPKTQVLGTGTYLDSQRLRVSLSKALGMSAHCIHAYVLGEHGDSQIVPRSIIKIGGCSIDRYNISDEELSKIEKDTMHKAYEIISKKGATNHGIGEAVAQISQSIMMNDRAVIPVSAFVPKYNCCIGWPSVVSKNGVEQTLPLQLLPAEEQKLVQCVTIIRKAADTLLLKIDK